MRNRILNVVTTFIKMINNTFPLGQSRMCCLFYSLFAKIVKINAIKVMFNIIETFKDDSPNFNELVIKFIKSKVNSD